MVYVEGRGDGYQHVGVGLALGLLHQLFGLELNQLAAVLNLCANIALVVVCLVSKSHG